MRQEPKVGSWSGVAQRAAFQVDFIDVWAATKIPKVMHWPAPHIRGGMLRLYLALAIPWTLAVGYIAYDNHRW